MKKVNCRSEKEVIGIKWIAKVMDFGVSLTVIEALNDGLNAFLAVRGNKKVYRQKVKQLANEAEKKMSLKKVAILAEMKDKKFFDTYSDAVIDLAEKDVQDFRSSIKKVLDENNVHDSDMIADVETARVMFVFATIHYNSVMEAAKSKFGNCHKELFNHFDLTDIRQAWERLCHLLYANQTADLNTESVQEKYDQMSEKFVNGVYVSDCVKEAKKACPYVYDEIKPDNLVN